MFLPTEEFDEKLMIIKEIFPDISDINDNAPLMKEPSLKLKIILEKLKAEGMIFEYPSKLHFLSHTLEVHFINCLYFFLTLFWFQGTYA